MLLSRGLEAGALARLFHNGPLTREPNERREVRGSSTGWGPFDGEGVIKSVEDQTLGTEQHGACTHIALLRWVCDILTS